MSIRVRIIACLCILSVLVSLIALSQAMSEISHDPEYTEYNEGVAATTGNYFMENWNRLGRLYLVNSTGDVLNMTDSGVVDMSLIQRIDVANDSVYAIFTSTYQYVKDIYRVYRIACFSPTLEYKGATDYFVLDAVEDVKSLDVIENSMYVTTIGSEGKTINVYEFPLELIKEDDADKKEKGKNLFDTETFVKGLDRQMSLVYRESMGGQYFSDAYYDGNEIVLLQDKDRPTGRFTPDMRVKSAVDAMHFNLFQQALLYSNYLIWWLGGLAIWFIVMVLIFILIRRRNRSLYVFVITEALYLTVLALTILFVRDQYSRSETRQNVRYAMLSMRQQLDYLPDLTNITFNDADFYESDSYRSIVDELRRYVASGYNKSLFYDMFIMDTKTGNILVDALGHSRESSSFNYSSAMTDVQEDLKRHDNAGYASFRMNDERLIAVGIPDDDPGSGYSIVSICHSQSGSYTLWNDGRSLLILFLIVFLVGSLLIAFIFYLMSLDMRNFELAIRDVALGRIRIKVPETVAQDVASMWNSLSEICKRMEEINYEKFRIFEAYYRFAPKNIETIMGKDSIFDVNNGDVVHVEGTLMLLNSRGDENIDRKVRSVTNIMSFMNQFTEHQEGVLVAQDSSLSVLRFFFLKDFTESSSKAVQFLHRNSSDENSGFVSAFLYSDSFIYGVAGIKAQSLCFITSARTKELELYAEWFGEMKVPLVLTDGVAKREDAGQTRYIGFIMLGGGRERIDLYEAIDAESARIRQLKLTTREKFEETLHLFYSREYYLARNQFSEILKECPEDSLAKWYLFESERYLNGETGGSDVGAIWINE